jgi:hypothetical protein
MSVTLMLTAETAFSLQLKLLVAPSTELPDLTAAASTNVRTDQTYSKTHTQINHPARIEVVSMYAMRAHGRSGGLVLWRYSSTLS